MLSAKRLGKNQYQIYTEQKEMPTYNDKAVCQQDINKKHTMQMFVNAEFSSDTCNNKIYEILKILSGYYLAERVHLIVKNKNSSCAQVVQSFKGATAKDYQIPKSFDIDKYVTLRDILKENSIREIKTAEQDNSLFAPVEKEYFSRSKIFNLKSITFDINTEQKGYIGIYNYRDNTQDEDILETASIIVKRGLRKNYEKVNTKK